MSSAIDYKTVSRLEDGIDDSNVDSYISSSYAPFIPDGDITPVLTFSNLTIENVPPTAAIKSLLAPITSRLFQSVPNLESKIGVPVSGERKTILKNVSGTITSGFWGIMGASGSGKTTLLNVLAKRLDPIRMQQTTGVLLLNGKQYDKRKLKNFSAYLMQDDVLHPEFTVYETLWYAAFLRLGSALTYEERSARIDNVMSILGIKHVKDVIVGDSRNKGISGGERALL